MKLVTLARSGNTRIGIGIDSADSILDLSIAEPRLPTRMVEFLTAGHPALTLAQAALTASPAKALIPASEVTLLAPLGPTLVTKDEVSDPHKLDLILTVNGEVSQHSNTGNTIFSIPFLIADLSQAMTLEPGDVVVVKVEKIGELVSPFTMGAE